MRIRSLSVGGAVIAMAAAAAITGATPALAASTEPAHFTGDGVRIRDCASSSCTVKGLGYRGENVGVYCVGGIDNIHKNGYVHIDDFTRNVAGWVSDTLVQWACD